MIASELQTEPIQNDNKTAEPLGDIGAIDEVYHFTSTDRVNVEHLNLRPNPERGRTTSWREYEQFLDDHRPEHIKRLGITRRAAIFANPTIGEINDYDSWGAWPAAIGHRIAVGVEVDPRKVVICEAKLVDPSTFKQARTQHPELVRSMADNYWGSAISLSEFRDLYEPVSEGSGSAVLKKTVKEEALRAGYRARYSEPEVLIPGPVSGDHLRVAAYGIHNHVARLDRSA